MTVDVSSGDVVTIEDNAGTRAAGIAGKSGSVAEVDRFGVVKVSFGGGRGDVWVGEDDIKQVRQSSKGGR